MWKNARFISAVFCPPTGPWEKFPDRLTDTVFQTLKDAGINRIFAFGFDAREETVQRTFRQCEKYGIGYCICLPSFGDYLWVLPGKNGEKPWKDLTETEKAELDARFVAGVQPYLEYPAFCGVFFEDECGYLCFDGIAHAKNVFDEHFPGYEFHANFFSYSINDEIFWGGMAFHGHPEGLQKVTVPFALTGDLEIRFENRFRFYNKLVDGLLSKAHFEFISQDKYPFEEFWPSVPTSVHKALFELNAFMKQKSLQYGSKFYNYMQVGTWGYGNRKMTFGEIALQMNVTAAYGAAGFGHFPGVFPLDWRHNAKVAHGSAGYIDIDGNPTAYKCCLYPAVTGRCAIHSTNLIAALWQSQLHFIVKDSRKIHGIIPPLPLPQESRERNSVRAVCPDPLILIAQDIRQLSDKNTFRIRQTPNGFFVKAVVIFSMNGTPTYSMWWIITLKDYLERTAAEDFVSRQMDYLEALVEQIAKGVDENGEMDYPGYFLDWPRAGQMEEREGARAINVMAAKSAIYLLERFGRNSQTAKLHLARLMKKEIKPTSKVVTALKYLAVGQLSDAEKEILLTGGVAGMSTFMSYYILKAVHDFEPKTATAMLKEYYGGMLKLGATTFWEDFETEQLHGSPIHLLPRNNKPDCHGDFGMHCYIGFRRSLCHGWSAGVIAYIKECEDAQS